MVQTFELVGYTEESYESRVPRKPTVIPFVFFSVLTDYLPTKRAVSNKQKAGLRKITTEKSDAASDFNPDSTTTHYAYRRLTK